ncbi:MAG: Acyl-CoA dehydrogenase, short-chain specific (EC 1.3.8.1) [Olavius algarvensis Delta 4 endosymbiont]|nr:MAG: Acyl-CoA dehydrogenase, short-chain specific (EC 1.3.8.1) [Olavius algarvensis Delta 4 endosymbiont]
MLNFNLSPELIVLQQKAREFALQEVLPLAWRYDQRDETSQEIIRKAEAAGLINGDIPEEYGGRGFGCLEAVILTEELAAACAGLATSIFDNSLGMEPLILCNNEALKAKYFPKILNDKKYIAFATSEPTMGSDVASLRCRAKRDGDDYILNGTKYWVTNGGLADYVSVFATVDPKSAHAGICAFIVETAWEGVSAGRPIPKMGQRTSNTTAINLKNVRVPKENMLAPPGEGFILAMQTFARTRPSIGAFAVGTARSAMEFAIDYAKKRKAFGSKIADFQSIQLKLAEMYQKVETARLLVWKAAWECDQGVDPNISASISKMYATEAAFEVVDQALQVMAGYGYTRFFPIEKLLRDVRLYRIYEGTSEVQRIILAGHVLAAYQATMPPLEDLAIEQVAHGEDPSATKTTGPRWRCRVCGYVHCGDEPPDECPYCFFPATAFKAV